jgi:serine/threonine protein kinase
MYEALTGNVPFLGRNYVETMSKQIGEPPPPFSTFASASAIPPALETIVMRALAKEPEKRYQSMGELRLDLESAFPEVVDQRRNKEKRANQRISRHRLRASESTVEAGTQPDQLRSSASTMLLVLVGLLLAALIYAALKLIETAKAPGDNGQSLSQPAPLNKAGESDKDPDFPEEHAPGSPAPGGGVWQSVPGKGTLPPDGTAKAPGAPDLTDHGTTKAPGAPDLPGDGSTKPSSISPEDTSSSAK